MASKVTKASGYYTAAETKEILGITNGMLYNYINNGTLERVIPPGKKQGVFQRNEVDLLAREMNAFLVQRKKKETTFTRVTTEKEMEECMEISQALFGVGRDTVKARMQLIKKNPEIYHMLRDETQIIGYTAIMPLKPGKLEKVLSQTLPVKIDKEDIENFDNGKEVDIYLHAIGVKPGFSTTEKHAYGARLINGIVELILGLGERGITIGSIAARSNMPDGIRLMRHAGFTEVEPLTPERRTFIIDIKESGIPFVMQYKQALNNSKTSV